jgi:hypothetical protein
VSAIEQRAVDPYPGRMARMGHHTQIASMLVDLEVRAERIADLSEIPPDLLDRFARVLQRLERGLMDRMHKEND